MNTIAGTRIEEGSQEIDSICRIAFTFAKSVVAEIITYITTFAYFSRVGLLLGSG